MAEPFTLPVSGKAVTFHKLKGLDFIEARRPLRDKDDQIEFGFSLLARRCEFDGRQAVLEDVLGLDEDDLAALMTAAGGAVANFTGSTPMP
jgi:hypothetical protein